MTRTLAAAVHAPAERTPAVAPGRIARRHRAPVGPLVVLNGQGSVARGALHVAEVLARRDRVNAHVVGLLRPVQLPRWVLAATDAGALQDGLRRQRHGHLRRQVHETVGRSIFFSTEVLVGSPLRTLRDAVREAGAEYVLVGLDDRNAPGRLRNEQRVLQVARVMERPVVAIPRGCTVLPTRALAAVSDDPSSRRAAQAAARMLAPGGTLTIAHVVREGEDDGRATARLEELARSLGAVPGIAVETALLRGEAAPALLELAGDAGCDLIAGGMSHGSARRGPGVGSTVAALLGGAPGAVLIANDHRTRHHTTHGGAT